MKTLKFDSKYTVTSQGKVEVLYVSLLLLDNEDEFYKSEFYNTDFDPEYYSEIKDKLSELGRYQSKGSLLDILENSDMNLQDIADEFIRVYVPLDMDLEYHHDTRIVIELLKILGNG